MLVNISGHTNYTFCCVCVIDRSQTWSWSWQRWKKGRSVLVIHKGLRHSGLRRPYTLWNTNLTEWVIKLFITKYLFCTFLVCRQTLYTASSPGPDSLQWAADQKQPPERGVADSSYWACSFPAATQQAWKGQRSHNRWFQKHDSNRSTTRLCFSLSLGYQAHYSGFYSGFLSSKKHVSTLLFFVLKELHEVRKKIGEMISLSTAAYDARWDVTQLCNVVKINMLLINLVHKPFCSRMEAQLKMTMMKEKAVKDLAQHNAEMKELERVIAHEYNLKDFMTTKCSERSGQDDSHEMGHRRRKSQPCVAANILVWLSNINSTDKDCYYFCTLKNTLK